MKRKHKGVEHSSIRAEFGRADRNTFCGFVYDEADATRKFSVELIVDGLIIATCYGDRLVASLVENQIGDGCFGFAFSLPEEVMISAQTVEARLANLSVPVGRPIDCDEIEASISDNRIADIKWVGGLRFEGWVALEGDNDEAIEISVGQEPILKIRPSGWTHVDINDGIKAARRISFYLPDRFADGCVRILSARTAGGRSITPQPLAFVAFDNGLETALAQLGRWESERLRGKLFDQLVPASLPFSSYQAWKARFPLAVVEIESMKAAIIMVGGGSIDETIDSLESQHHPDWTAIALPVREGVTEFDPKAALRFLEGEADDSEFVVFVLAGAVFSEFALQRIARAFRTKPDCICCYGDVDVVMDDRSVWPLAFPAFDRERMLEQGYAAHLFALRRKSALRALNSSHNLYRLFNSSFDKFVKPSAVLHIPGALATLPRIDTGRATRELVEATRAHMERGPVRATVMANGSGIMPAVRVRRDVPKNSRTMIIIPTRNRVALLKRCVESIMPAVKKAAASVMIVDNESNDQETLKYLDVVVSLGVEVISVGGPFNFSRINNFAVQHVNAYNLCLLNNDIEATDDDWLLEMLSRLSDPGVGAVGARLLWPSGIVQHGGVVLGTNFAAAHAFNDRMDGDPGYGDMLKVAHECAAVTAACLLVRREDYLSVGGMDEVRFPVNFNDVDLCLKLREGGKTIVFTPHARLLHLESASRGKDETEDRKARFERELRLLRNKWGQSLIDDAYYNPTLALDSAPYSALAWPPRSWQPRSNLPPQGLSIPSGF